MAELPTTPVTRYETLRNAFFSGVILVAPLALTIWVFAKIIEFVGGALRPVFFVFVPNSLRDRPSLETVWDILATVIAVVLVTALGYVSRYVFGKFFFS